MRKAKMDKDNNYICRKCGEQLIAMDFYKKKNWSCGEFHCGCNLPTHYKLWKIKSIRNTILTNMHKSNVAEIFVWRWKDKSRKKGKLIYGCGTNPSIILNRLEWKFK